MNDKALNLLARGVLKFLTLILRYLPAQNHITQVPIARSGSGGERKHVGWAILFSKALI